MAATNINVVVLTGNLTRDPELRSLPSGMSVCSLRIASNTRRKAPVRRVGGQAELLRRDRLGRPGRELRALPLQGPPGRARRPPRVARVADAGRPEAPERRDHRRLRPVPRRPRRAARAAATASPRSRTSRSTTATSSRRARPRRRQRPRGRRHPVLGRKRHTLRDPAPEHAPGPSSPRTVPAIPPGRVARVCHNGPPAPPSARGFVRPRGAS